MIDFIDLVMPLALGGLMVGVGLGIEFRDLRAAVSRGRIVVAVVLTMQVGIPAICLIGASFFELPAATAAGLVLLASCPGGIFSNYVTRVGRGNVGLSVALTVIVTLVYAVVAPFWATQAAHLMSRGAVGADAYSPWQVLTPLVGFVVLPAAGGILIRSRWPAFALRIAKWLREPAAIALLLIYVLILYRTRATLVDGLRNALVCVLAFNLLSVVAAVFVARTLHLVRSDAVAVQIEHAIRQEGTGVYIATAILGNPLITYPLLLNSITGMLFAWLIVLAVRLSKRSVEPLP